MRGIRFLEGSVLFGALASVEVIAFAAVIVWVLLLSMIIGRR